MTAVTLTIAYLEDTRLAAKRLWTPGEWWDRLLHLENKTHSFDKKPILTDETERREAKLNNEEEVRMIWYGRSAFALNHKAK